MKNPIDFKLILITEGKFNNNLYKTISSACRAGVKAVQIREKHISAKELLIISKKIRTITKQTKIKLFINDRYDIAMLSKADGLHVPENGINPAQVVKSKFITGKSVHSLIGAVEAEKNGFDYIFFGPVFRTPAKVKFGKPQGLENLKTVCGSVKIPVFAVGGINPNRAKKCIQSGAYGVAVIREIMNSKNVIKTVNEFNVSLGIIGGVRSGDPIKHRGTV